ncbi:XrtA/PEP-CTERM system TPR-repeat protein PrsT [Rubrivivax albus]|nr:XrtA/PEP-CTERM system TPR-repeat protein PrsT [Rubrivivax albus]
MHRLLAPTLLASLLMVACGGKDPAELVASAKGFAEKGDHKAAIIELKTAIQEAPDLAEARFLLGESLLASGDVAGAALELRKALDLRHDENDVVPPLARALYLQGDFQRLLEQFGTTVLSQPLAEADLKVTLARANGGLGRREPARRAIDAALKAMPEYGPAKIFEARLQADTGDVDGALAALDKQLERTPQDAEGWQIKGDLMMYGKRDLDGALAAYRQAIAVRPTHVVSHAGALTVLLAKADADGAKAQLEGLQKILPKHPQTLFFAASVALLNGELDKAKEIGDQLLRVAADNARILQLVGAIEFERKSWIQAETHLAKAVQLNPNLDMARRMLAGTYLQRSEPSKALSTLQPLTEKPNVSAAIYNLKAQAHLQAGELAEAEKAFAAATKINPDDVRNRTALALSRVMRGDDNAGLGELRSLAASADTTVADLPLIATLVRKKDFKGAMAAIDALERKQPDKPIAANLRARLLIQQGDKAGAEKAFRRALEIQPTFFPAAASLVQLAFLDKRLDEAQKILDDFLKVAPTNTQALITSAALKVRTGAARDEVLGIFTRAIQQAPTEPMPRLALINYQLNTQDVKGALSTAQQAVAALPDNPGLLDALGRAQAASGDTNQALASFGKLAQMVPTSVAPHLRVADVQWAAKNQEAAIQALRRALGVDADNLQAQRSLVDAYLASDKTADAVAVARQVRKQRPQQDVGYLLEGGIAASQRQWPQAIAIYRDGLKSAPDSSELATRLHVALAADKQDAEAARHAADWQRRHPDDAAFRFFLGDLALARKDLTAAEGHYRDVLRIQPENALALNNVAWLMASTKKPGAVAMAEKAVALLPDRPVIMDTLALALASEGQKDKAVDIMRQAVRLEEKNPSLRFNLAKLLIDAGDKSAAKTELETLAKLGDKFPRQGEVTALLKTL